jgi:ABC-type dipeptide/oligopeptide/nickel transport system permease component
VDGITVSAADSAADTGSHRPQDDLQCGIPIATWADEAESSETTAAAAAIAGERCAMSRYIFRRILAVVPTLWVVYTVTFLVMHATPGGPWDNAEKPLPKEVVENIKAKYHLNEPLWKQYLIYLGNVLHGDFGPSYVNRSMTASDIVRTFFPVSVQLGAVAMAIGVAAGLGLGVLAAVKQNRPADHLAMFLAVIGISTPSYVTATLLIVVLSLTFHLVPTGGWGGVLDRRIIIPALALAFAPAAALARYTRSSTLEVLRQDYVRTARAKGLRQTTILARHVLKNALVPVITVGGLIFAGIVTGSFFVETVSGVPGIGRYFVTAATSRDYPVLMAVTLLFAVLVILMNLLVDIAYGFLDPRIRY